jgi:hypothetical protein
VKPGAKDVEKARREARHNVADKARAVKKKWAWSAQRASLCPIDKQNKYVTICLMVQAFSFGKEVFEYKSHYTRL